MLVKMLYGRALVAVTALCASISVIQFFMPVFTVDEYALVAITFALAIALSLHVGSEKISLLCLGFLWTTLITAYAVHTHLTALPFGDPYGGFGVLQLILSTHHATIFPQPSYAPSLGVGTYSQWPGRRAF